MHHVSHSQSGYTVAKQPARSITIIVLCMTYSNAAECTPEAAVMCDEDASCEPGSNGYTCGEALQHLPHTPSIRCSVVLFIRRLRPCVTHAHDGTLNVTDGVVPGTSVFPPFERFLPDQQHCST